MELTGLLQMAPFQGMKEEELVAFLFGLPNSLKHFEPGDIIARQGDLCKGLYILASGSVRAGMINDEGKELFSVFMSAQQEIDGITAIDNFILGFRLGVRLMIDCMDENDITDGR